MFSDIAIEFENITKFALLDYFEEYRDFMQDDYTYMSAYYSGSVEGIDGDITNRYKDLKAKSKNLLQTFINFSHRLSNCGFWELQQYCQDLNDVLEKIEKLPKYYRTTKTNRGYMPFVQVQSSVGAMRTPQDLAQQIDSTGVSELSLILDNDLQELDWEIDKLTPVQATVNNGVNIVVETILEQPVEEKIYGKDINRKITFKDNDLDVMQYQNNVEQKCDILLTLNKGDVPEWPAFGRNRLEGNTAANYNYVQLLTDLQNTVLQDDLFASVTITDITGDNGTIQVTCEIRTKYSYSTSKTITI